MKTIRVSFIGKETGQTYFDMHVVKITDDALMEAIKMALVIGQIRAGDNTHGFEITIATDYRG